MARPSRTSRVNPPEKARASTKKVATTVVVAARNKTRRLHLPTSHMAGSTVAADTADSAATVPSADAEPSPVQCQNNGSNKSKQLESTRLWAGMAGNYKVAPALCRI